MILPLLLLLAAPTRVMLMDDVVTIPRGEWRALPVILQQQAATVEGSFRVLHGPPAARLALLTKEEAAELRKGPLHTEIAATPQSAQGSFSVPIRTLGEYELMVDNREGRAAVDLHLTVALIFGANPGLEVRYVSPRRRTVIVLASLSFFVAVAGLAGARLRRAMDHRP